ncbi:MAG: galactose mutarotase [Oscillospiraceae bacterium]|nr:galactose mutarotase [Oscillospiraceae bacterium]
MTKEFYGTHPNGTDVYAYTLDNGSLKAKFLSFGAAIDELWVPDRHGTPANVLIGHADLQDRIENNTARGEVCGRVCNRINGAKFTLNGEEFNLTPSPEGQFTLHGASEFNTALWDVAQVDDTAITFTYTSAAGTHGFPGTVTTQVRYTLDGSALRIEYEATSDADTVINLTNHAYFNLAGVGSGQIFSQQLRIDAEHYLPLNDMLCPTGELAAVAGTRFDFRQLREIGEIYDVNFCNPGAVEALDPVSGRRLVVETDLPGVQLYTGECLCEPFTGFCLETQFWPDAPNQPDFPSIVVRAGEKWTSWTKFSFDVA